MCLAQLSTPVQGRSEWEVFYAYPSISAPALFEALAAVSEDTARAPASAAEAHDALLELSRAAQVRASIVNPKNTSPAAYGLPCWRMLQLHGSFSTAAQGQWCVEVQTDRTVVLKLQLLRRRRWRGR